MIKSKCLYLYICILTYIERQLYTDCYIYAYICIYRHNRYFQIRIGDHRLNDIIKYKCLYDTKMKLTAQGQNKISVLFGKSYFLISRLWYVYMYMCVNFYFCVYIFMYIRVYVYINPLYI
jgi:hypothetical protein